MGRSSIELSYVIPLYYTHDDHNSLVSLIKQYQSFDSELVSKIEFVIVDDCSVYPIRLDSDLSVNFQLLRIKDNIHWNVGGARNLGVLYASGPRIIITDVDHFFPEQLLMRIVASKVPTNRIFKFKRRHKGKKISYHRNSFYTSRAVFFASFGYDEEFSGHYGHEDVFFTDFQQRLGNKLEYFTRFRYIEANPDREMSTHDLIRDTSFNKKLHEEKLALLPGRNPYLALSRKFLNFSYEKVAENWI